MKTKEWGRLYTIRTEKVLVQLIRTSLIMSEQKLLKDNHSLNVCLHFLLNVQQARGDNAAIPSSVLQIKFI